MLNPITVTQLEAAINFWRQRIPATGEEARLCMQAAALAAPYALMIFNGEKSVDLDALSPKARQAYDEATAALPPTAAP